MKIIQHPAFTFTIFILPVIFEIINTISGPWSRPLSGMKVFLIIIVFIYLIMCVLEFVLKTRSVDRISTLEEQLSHSMKSESNALNSHKSLLRIITYTDDQIKSQRKKMRSSGIENLIISFPEFSAFICQELYSLLDHLISCDKHFTLNIYYKTHENNKYWGEMIAHEGHMTQPDSYGKKVELKKQGKLNLCFRILRDNKKDYIILLSKDQVAEAFNKSINDCKYSQYIGIPISNSDGNVCALLEINILDDYLPFKTQDDIMKLLGSHIEIFKQYILVIVHLQDFMNTINRECLKGGVDHAEESQKI